MSTHPPLGSNDLDTSWLDDPVHRNWLAHDAAAQFAFFRHCLRSEPGFDVLDLNGKPIPGALQELHSTTRMVHSYALGHIAGSPGADKIIDHGMAFLWSHHRDSEHGGYVWALNDNGTSDGTKLAYGHVFVLLAGASAKMAGHPDADRLIADATEVLDTRYWDEERGLLHDEYTRDWQPFSTYRGMNANMHGIEALLTAHEATGDAMYLNRAGRILDFFVGRMAPAHGWRLPEHYTHDWQVDSDYDGNPMFRPGGTTPGHSFEFARLLLQYWDLKGRPEDGSVAAARSLFETALTDANDTERGGFAYTVNFDGSLRRGNRYWWPVTEAIGTAAAFLKLDGQDGDEALYRDLWAFAARHLIDHAHGGWFPELDEENRPTATQFNGKPDIYHSVQATLFPMSERLSGIIPSLRGALSSG